MTPQPGSIAEAQRAIDAAWSAGWFHEMKLEWVQGVAYNEGDLFKRRALELCPQAEMVYDSDRPRREHGAPLIVWNVLA